MLDAAIQILRLALALIEQMGPVVVVGHPLVSVAAAVSHEHHDEGLGGRSLRQVDPDGVAVDRGFERGAFNLDPAQRVALGLVQAVTGGDCR